MPTKLKENVELQVIDYRYDLGIRGRIEYEILPTITTNNGFSSMPMIMKNYGGGTL